jgi:hypothetical protein
MVVAVRYEYYVCFIVYFSNRIAELYAMEKIFFFACLHESAAPLYFIYIYASKYSQIVGAGDCQKSNIHALKTAYLRLIPSFAAIVG